jgi:hypothetical protein
MSVLGKAAVAIWHDIAPEGREEFYAWHGREHMPERVGIPGFLRGRRFIAIDADLEFFNLYETRDIDVVKGEDYRARLNKPTPWTLSTVRHFRSVARALSAVAFTSGASDGGLVATLRYDVPDEAADDHRTTMVDAFLPALADHQEVAGVHMLIADLGASGEGNEEQRARGTRNDVPRYVLIAEGWGDDGKFVSTLRDALSSAELDAAGVRGARNLGFYRHQITLCSGGPAT